MNLTDLRGRPISRAPSADSERQADARDQAAVAVTNGAAEAKRRQLATWLGGFCRLHHVSVRILDATGATLAGPMQEPSFCSVVKCALPQGCPEDCGRSRHATPRSSTPQLFHCPYHLSNIAWVVRADEKGVEESAWTVILGRTLATQAQLTNCLDVVQEAEEIGDEALAALGSIPWMAEPQLAEMARFLHRSLELILDVGPEKAKSAQRSSLKGKALSHSHRKREQG